MLEKYKNDQEFYSLVGIKAQTFNKMIEILKIAESKQKYYGGRKKTWNWISFINDFRILKRVF